LRPSALVTGASRGIGEAIARRLAAAGHPVALLARGLPDLERVGGELREAGATVTWAAADLTDAEARASALDRIEAELGPIGVLVNNAGGNIRKPSLAYTAAEWDGLLQLSLSAPFALMQRVAPGMQEAGFGRIVNIGSVAGMRALPTGAPYAAAKAGLAHLTRVLAREWGASGITVNCVAPWYVRTPLTEPVLDDPSYGAAVLACTPSGTLGSTKDVAAAVAFLVGDDAAWINGVVLPVDGGFTASSFFPPA